MIVRCLAGGPHSGPYVVALVLILSAGTIEVYAQTSSLGARRRQADIGSVPDIAPRETPKIQRNAVYERYSWVTVKPTPLKTFKVGDLLTIVVREQRRFQAEADLEIKKRFNVKSVLNAFIKLTEGGVGATAFRRGQPTIDYKYDNRLTSEGDTQREDTLTMRVTGRVIDVKPNGLLVLEARARIQHDEEISTITFTGTCRKEDVTADNTILSTQVADKNVTVINHGALRSASSRGWILKLIDLFQPI